jgi:hypothetical protein
VNIRKIEAESMTKPIAEQADSRKSLACHSIQLVEPLLSRLNNYALGASAAGVALLACSNVAEAAPVCGSLSVTLNYTDTYPFNPAHQKLPPFNVAHSYNEISSHTQSRRARGFFTPNVPGALVLASSKGLPTDLASGASVGPAGNFGKGRFYGLVFGYYYFGRVNGNFPLNQSGYVGFQFTLSGHIHYGWLRMRVTRLGTQAYPSLLLSEFGYESAPNTASIVGNCGTSASTVQPVSPQPSPAALQEISSRPSASLGLLALGSQALLHWRGEMYP